MLCLSACQTPHPGSDTVSGKQAAAIPGTAMQQNPDGQKTPQTTQSAQQELSNAVSNYDNESLKVSRKELVNALNSGLLSRHDQVIAHKYLAFIYCTSHRKKLCHHEFREALKADPAFSLTRAEAGHPMWGPVFRTEKAKYEKSVFAHNEH